MFTGIIEEIGHVASIKRGAKSVVLTIKAKEVMEGTKLGDSIAVNGVCLTVTSLTAAGFMADVMHESMERSSLSKLKIGDAVNLERAMLAGGRFGGHIVSGHIDGMGKIEKIRQDDNAYWYKITASSEIINCIVMKGSITIDGISLTVAGLDDTSFSVSIIPHTRANTILANRKVGDLVNLENDIVGKYIQRFCAGARLDAGADNGSGSKKISETGLSMEMLAMNGFL
jgi:riboflavin synthase